MNAKMLRELSLDITWINRKAIDQKGKVRHIFASIVANDKAEKL